MITPDGGTLNATALLDAELGTPRPILGAWLEEGALGMIHAPRGVGKTFFSLSLAYAISTGQPLLGWSAPEPRRVLYIDGEMGAYKLKKRLQQICNGQPVAIAPDRMSILSISSFGGDLPNLSDPAAQLAIYGPACAHADVIIVDNEGCVCSQLDARDDEVKRWGRLRSFYLSLKAQGKTIVHVHHSGKSGAQLGTSQREQPMDWIVGLRPTTDVKSGFQLHFEKARDYASLDPMLVTFDIAENALTWQHRTLETLLCRSIEDAYTKLKNWNNVALALGIPIADLHRLRLKHNIIIKGEENEEKGDATRAHKERERCFR